MKKKASIKEVAKLAQVSPGTVSNYLNSSAPVNAETGQRIRDAISKLGYQRNEIASSLRRASTKTLGLILPDVRNPFYADFYSCIENEALANGYNIVFGSSDYDPERMQLYLDLFANRQVDGIILSSNYTYKLSTFPRQIDVPLVIVEPYQPQLDYPTVSIDNEKGSKYVVDFLIDKGHKDIAVITSSLRSPRYIGYTQALKAKGIKLKPNMVFEFGRFTNNLFKQGYEAMNALLDKQKFTACFVISDMLAIGAIAAAKNRGLRVPEDIAIAGFDNIPFSDILEPTLTTISQPVNEMGKYAVQKCIELLQSDDRPEPIAKVFDVKLIQRNSV